MQVHDIGDAFWIDVDDRGAVRLAERALIERLPKLGDGPISRYLNRPLSTRISRRLVARSVSPNQISAFCFGLSRATELGYRGISVKNCKGVFRALLNRGLCEKRNLDLASSGEFFQSAEDLTNLPVLALQQDLTTVAALGFEHVERNGHHYFHGLDHLPQGEVRQALERHAGLYRSSGSSAFLDIQGGELDLRSLDCVGYGHDVEVEMDARQPCEEWAASTAPTGGAQ